MATRKDKNLCIVDGCNRKKFSRGFCASHYQRFRQGKEVNVPIQIQNHGLSKLERFELRVEKTDNCWLWTASRNNKGYGQFNYDGTRPIPAHRAAWMIYKGEIPDGMCILHKCDVPLCVNPDHLFLGTQIENIADMHSKGRAKQGHLYGPDHKAAKLDAEKVKEIRASSKSDAELAEIYGVSRPTIWAVVKGKTWKHII